MAGLVAMFSPDGLDVSLSDLTKRFPSHAAKRDEWRDACFAAVRLHHGKVNPAPQPLWDETGNVCVFMDGHLYEEDEGGHHQNPEGSPSAAACLRAYQAGPDALAALNGNFALIIYDKKRRSVTLVSDQLNTRPLYYFQAGREIVVSSHIAALTGHPRCPKILNRQALHELIVYRQVLGQSTIYHGIERLEPASIVTFDGQLSTPHPYWTPEFRAPTFSRREAPIVMADGFRKAAQRRVSRNLRHGVLLSGGLDSRAILASSEKPLDCFTVGSSENQQVQTARKVAELRGAPHHFLPVDPDGFWTHFEESVRLTGGMYGCQQAHFSPVLDAVKSVCDVVFIGNNMDAYFRGNFLPARKLTIAGSSQRLPILIDDHQTDEVTALFRAQKQAFPRTLAMRVLTNEAAGEHESRITDSVRELIRNYDRGMDDSPLRVCDFVLLRYLAQRFTFPNILCIRSRMDDEVLVWDRDLVELYLQMPLKWRHPDAVFRAALGRLSLPLAKVPYADTGLPATAHPYAETASVMINRSLRYLRKKTGTLRPDTDREPWLDFDNMLRRVAPLRERVAALSKSDALAACGLFDPSGIEGVADDHLRGDKNLGRFLLILLTIDSWIRQFGAEGSA